MDLSMQKKALDIQKELELTVIESEIDGLVISVNGQMKVEKVEFETDQLIGNKKELEKAILKSINKGLTAAQEAATKKMQPLLGNFMK